MSVGVGLRSPLGLIVHTYTHTPLTLVRDACPRIVVTFSSKITLPISSSDTTITRLRRRLPHWHVSQLRSDLESVAREIANHDRPSSRTSRGHVSISRNHLVHATWPRFEPCFGHDEAVSRSRVPSYSTIGDGTDRQSSFASRSGTSPRVSSSVEEFFNGIHFSKLIHTDRLI